MQWILHKDVLTIKTHCSTSQLFWWIHWENFVGMILRVAPGRVTLVLGLRSNNSVLFSVEMVHWKKKIHVVIAAI